MVIFGIIVEDLGCAVFLSIILFLSIVVSLFSFFLF